MHILALRFFDEQQMGGAGFIQLSDFIQICNVPFWPKAFKTDGGWMKVGPRLTGASRNENSGG
ncbi:hypothetical protein [Pseudophaeobacter sp.]|uniref:hypothetical protein n=1 Tax=Pseudophaeobacter sp. TaxID=1971739 RepID=UPI004058C3F4